MSKNEKWKVYMHTCPNAKRYIGITSQNPNKRWRNGKGYKTQELFRRAIKKYGWDNIVHEVLYSGLSENEAKSKEIELIAKYNAMNSEYGYNLTGGGNGGVISEETRKKLSNALKNPSAETRRKLSEAKKGNQYMLGKKRSEETKRKVSEARKGKPLSDEHRKKLSESHMGNPSGMKGKTHTEATKQKLSAASKSRTGDKSPNYGKQFSEERKRKIGETKGKRVLQIDKCTGTIIAEFYSANEAGRQTNIHFQNIVAVCIGKPHFKTAGGYIWRYADEQAS